MEENTKSVKNKEWYAVKGEGTKLEYTIQTNAYQDKDKMTVETIVWVEKEKGIYDLVHEVRYNLGDHVPGNSYLKMQNNGVLKDLIEGKLDLYISNYLQRINTAKKSDGIFEGGDNTNSKVVKPNPEDNLYGILGFSNPEDADSALKEMFKR